MKWTKRVPTKQGWYWRKSILFDASMVMDVVCFRMHEDVLLECHRDGTFGEYDAQQDEEFAGPIPYPSEKGVS